MVLIAAAGLLLASLAAGENPPAKTSQTAAIQPANELANALARRLSDDLHIKTVVGEPVKVGAVTLIPIMMIDVGFGGGGIAAPGGGDAFFMSGEARLLGFVVIGKKGTRFISVAKPAAK
jgi:uncharacterized spore protein YtfJ